MDELLQPFLRQHPWVHQQQIYVHLIGYGMGGFLAKAVTIMADTFFQENWIKPVCTTFDSPGVPPSLAD